MLTLGIDTSTAVCAVGLRDKDGFLGEMNVRLGRRHSERLLPVIAKLFSELEYRIEDVKGLAVTTGPGSFTGLRIGLSTVKAFARALGIPVYAVPTLDLLAYSIYSVQGIIVPVLDARRGRVYNALYRGGKRDVDGSRLCADRALPAEELLAELLREYPGESYYLIGDGVEVCRQYLNENEAAFKLLLSAHSRPSGALLAGLGAYYLQRDGGMSPEELTPRYLKKPQAEINYRRRSDGEKQDGT
ncbi:MAG: tRNA (adenosine(37)-N6)-threonylcarbamoyltransferase complex dimerization subunit type 1 TsaB [Halanaerobiaceae bacterium]